jgi:hypothetical protein
MNNPFLSPAKLLAVLLSLLFSHAAFSQDDIIMRNDDVVKAKVEEVGVDVIRYRKADNMDGPMYDMPKRDVYMIVYNNGSRDVINPRDGQQQGGYADAAIRQAPPEMPVYEQPFCPGAGYLWTPGYWAFGAGGYYWVPGVWVMAPRPGYLWTPGYWGFGNGIYGWHEGYWGEHIGFYGGVNYGYGYGGRGYEGGRWEGGEFRYNTAVTRVDVTVVHTTYVDNTVVRNNSVAGRSSFNGEGGVRVEAASNERAAMSENHVRPTAEQQTHVEAARSDKSQYVSENHGKPTVAAMNKPNGEHFGPEGHPTEAHPNTVTGAPKSAAVQPEHRNEPALQSPHSNVTPANSSPAEHNNATPAEHTNSSPAEQHPAAGQPARGGAQQHTNMIPGNNLKPAAKPAAKPAPKAEPAKPAGKK